MIKVSFNSPEMMYEKSEEGNMPFECLHLVTSKLTPRFFQGLNLMIADGYIGYIKYENIKSIEPVKPTDL